MSVKKIVSGMQTGSDLGSPLYDVAIMNYQGPLPSGTWYCDSCSFETSDTQTAARHSSDTGSWVWLFEPQGTMARFEIHGADFGGVYLAPTNRLTKAELVERRRTGKHSIEVFEPDPVSDEEWNRQYQDVRTTGPDTSHDASQDANRGEVRTRVLKLFQEHGRLTDERLLARYIALYGVIPESSSRKRRCDLVRLGKIRNSGVRARLSTGKMGILWELAEDKANDGIQTVSTQADR